MDSPAGDSVLCVLVNHGSFNPVHCGHIEMMVQAKAAVEAVGYVVLKAVLAPTSAEWIEYKGAQALDPTTREGALRAAVKPHNSWLEVDMRGTQVASGGVMLRSLILPELEPKHGAVVGFSIRGADLGPPKKFGTPTVCIDRGPGTGLKEKIAEINCDSEGLPRHIYVPPLGEESSTKVRTALLNGRLAEIESLCGSDVAAYLWQARAAGTLWAKQKSARRRCLMM
eukprot:TRINITY_DN73644_c0_g1_i1.p1 TRINITY_DN73644_c0_g1~~TRINITY_DN73644_c0_g1_i1.p1  ORF type:complete len:242 (+),score=44.35 TRINITY_DN73644_c0_g1_i1:50-727(+)